MFKVDEFVFTPEGSGWVVDILDIGGYPLYMVQEGTVVTGYFADEIS